MWRRSDRSSESVVCIACGDECTRGEAREYDKEGDRWDRQDKEFEYLCKACDNERSHQPRQGLEARLEEVSEPGQTAEEFVHRYLVASAEQADDDPSA